MIEIGKRNTLQMVRKSDLGFMLTDGKEEILMHYKESLKELEENEQVTVYVYTDKENRKTATMQEPKLFLEEPNFVTVVNGIDIGIFVGNGTPKDLFISKDNLPYRQEQWPIVGDTLFCGLKLKKNYLVAKPLGRYDILACHSSKQYEENERVIAYVQRILEKGLGLITEDRVYVFIPNTQLRRQYRLGEKVEVTITKMLSKEAYGTLNEHKEILMDEDKVTILEYLKAHKGVLPLTAKSSSEEVEKIFNMSRKAFKRAYGALYKEQRIDFDDTKTFLKEL